MLIFLSFSNLNGLILEPFECNDGPNEEVGCGPYDRKCATLNEPRLEEKKCYPGCYCKPGYARDEYKQCVHISDCKQSNRKYH